MTMVNIFKKRQMLHQKKEQTVGLNRQILKLSLLINMKTLNQYNKRTGHKRQILYDFSYMSCTE